VGPQVSQLLDDIRPILQVTPAQALCMERLLDQHYAISGRYTRRYVNLLLPLLLVFPGRGTALPPLAPNQIVLSLCISSL
jgi:hypothetical protein